MCELFGINSKKKININEYLKIFYSHSEKHNYGWGLANFYGDSVSLEKEAIKANGSYYLKQRLQHPIVIDNAIAHIRLATIGNMSYENCHPFVKHDNMGRCWTLAHNGTIFNSQELEKYRDVQEGQTDSERILFHIIATINKSQQELGRPLAFEERFALLDNLVYNLSRNNKINLLFWDSETMYVHCNYSNTLHYKQLDNQTVLFSTQPLQDDGTWHLVDFQRLLAYKDGQLIMRGNNTTFEYISPERDWEYKNIDYSYL